MSTQLTKTQQTNAVSPIMIGLLLNMLTMAMDPSIWRTGMQVLGLLLVLGGVFLMGKYMRQQKAAPSNHAE